jgi:hypothetical protein
MNPTDTHVSIEGEKQPSNPVSDVEVSKEDNGIAPQDGGRGAWTFLFGAAIVEISAWGTTYIQYNQTSST